MDGSTILGPTNYAYGAAVEAPEHYGFTFSAWSPAGGLDRNNGYPGGCGGGEGNNIDSVWRGLPPKGAQGGNGGSTVGGETGGGGAGGDGVTGGSNGTNSAGVNVSSGGKGGDGVVILRWSDPIGTIILIK